MALMELNHRLDTLLDTETWLGMEVGERKKEEISVEQAKENAAVYAVDTFVKSRMVVGLGTGSTAEYAVRRLAEKLAKNELRDIVCIPTSEETRMLAYSLGIELSDLNNFEIKALNTKGYSIDVTIDGADAYDKNMNLIKGGGAALLREKMIEKATEQFICITDSSKRCERFGGEPSARKVPVKLPVEIVQFCHNHVIKVITQKLSYQGCTAKLRLETDNKPTITDNGNYIVDLYFETTIVRPETIAADLEKITGVVEHGLFCNMAKVIVVANRDNTTTLIKKPLPSPIRF